MSADGSKLGTLKAQGSMFDRARFLGFERKNIVADSGFAESTLATWARGEAEMPLSAFRRLIASGALPLDVLSMLLPDGVVLGSAGEGGMDHAALAGAAVGYVGKYGDCRHPDSEAGSELGPSELALLRAEAARLKGLAQ